MARVVLALCVVAVALATSCKKDHYLLPDAIDGERFCAQCDSGTHTPHASVIDGEWACVACESMPYSDVSFSALCAQTRGVCAAGEYNKCVGSDCMKDCRSCPQGYFGATEGVGNCEECGYGTFQFHFAQTSCDVCHCPAGHKSISHDDSTFAEKSHNTQHINHNTHKSQCGCLECGLGTFSEGNSLDCTDCQAGTYQGIPGSSECTKCMIDTYSPAIGQQDSTTCVSCPVGQFTKFAGATASTECTTTQCHLGYYRENGDCHACAAGSYGIVESNGQHGCSACTDNTISAAGDTGCTECPETHLADSTHAICSIECGHGQHVWEKHQWTDISDLSKCVACGVGQYSDTMDTSTECVVCEAGKYQNQIAMFTCATCPAGQHPNADATGCITVDTVTPTKSPTQGTPAPSPMHSAPGLHVHMTLPAVSVQDVLDHQVSVGSALDNLNLGATYTSKILGATAGTPLDACHSVTLAGLSAGETNFDRMGVYHKVAEDVYRDSNNQFYLFKHTSAGNGIRWLVGMDYHTDGAVLLTEADTLETATEWFDYRPNDDPTDKSSTGHLARYHVAGFQAWHAAALTATCNPTPQTIVHVLFAENDCANGGGSADLHNIKAAINSIASWQVQAYTVALNAAGLLVHNMGTSAITFNSGILVSCAPVIHLVMAGDDELNAAIPATCTYKDGSMVIDHRPAGTSAENYHCKYHKDPLTSAFKCMCQEATESFAP